MIAADGLMIVLRLFHIIGGVLWVGSAFLFVAAVAYVEGRAIVRTIRRLVEAARAIAHGDLNERVPVQGRDEFALLGRTFNQMASQLQNRLDELEAERGRLRDVISSFGEALGATHDVDQLMRLIVEAAMEACRNEAGSMPHRRLGCSR